MLAGSIYYTEAENKTRFWLPVKRNIFKNVLQTFQVRVSMSKTFICCLLRNRGLSIQRNITQ